MAEVVAKNAVPWMERQLQQLEVGNAIGFAALPSVCLKAQISQTRKAGSSDPGVVDDSTETAEIPRASATS